MFKNPDLHMHSVFSDGSDTPEELLQKVMESGVDIFSLTDHDTFDGCLELQKLVTPSCPKFITGIELSCKDEAGKYHILGYCCNVEKAQLRSLIEETHNARVKKAIDRIEFLRNSYGFSFTDADVATILNNKNPGKPHFAQLLLKKGYTKSKDEGFELLSSFVEHEKKVPPSDAIGAIIDASGIPVLAHGILGSGTQNLTEEQISERVVRLMEYGLAGLECYYSSYTPEQNRIMLSLAEKYKLLVTAGSDYHGENKSVHIGQTSSPAPENMERFYKAISTLL